MAKIENGVVKVWDFPDDGEPGWRDARPDEIVPHLIQMVAALQDALSYMRGRSIT